MTRPSIGFVAASAILSLVAAAGCQGGLGAFQQGVGSTKNIPPGASFRVLGQVGTQFSAVVSDATSSWLVQGSIPLNVVLVNNTTPVRMTATKQSPGFGIMSLELTVGFTVSDIASTTMPFGTASVQSATTPGFEAPPPLANPDVRLYVKGPPGERFSALVEDTETGFEESDRAPTMFLFESPNGKVDANFTQIQDLGPFVVDMIVDGSVVASVSGGPTVTLKQP